VDVFLSCFSLRYGDDISAGQPLRDLCASGSFCVFRLEDGGRLKSNFLPPMSQLQRIFRLPSKWYLHRNSRRAAYVWCRRFSVPESSRSGSRVHYRFPPSWPRCTPRVRLGHFLARQDDNRLAPAVNLSLFLFPSELFYRGTRPSTAVGVCVKQDCFGIPKALSGSWFQTCFLCMGEIRNRKGKPGQFKCQFLRTYRLSMELWVIAGVQARRRILLKIFLL